VIGPIAITFLFVTISGVRMLEKVIHTCTKAASADYIRRASSLIESLRWIPLGSLVEEGGDSPQGSRHFGLTL